MGLFDVFKKSSNGQFVTEKQFKSNADTQVELAPQTLKQLRELGVTDDKELKLEFFFYSNTVDKVERLSTELKKMNYEVEFGQSQGDKKLFISTGWTSKMKWTMGLLRLGQERCVKLATSLTATLTDGGRHPNKISARAPAPNKMHMP